MVKKISDNQVERLLDLVPYLTANPGVSLEKIAQDFESTRSTILEDLNTLWMCGLPGYTPLELIDLSFDTGYVTIRNADVLSKPRKLTTSEIAAIIIGLSIILESITPSNENYVAISELLKHLSTAFRVPQPDLIQDPKLAVTKKMISDALNLKKNVEMIYFSYTKDEKRTRLVTPLRLRVIESYEYVDAYCHLSEGFRLFRLDRIESCKILEADKFEVPTNDVEVERNVNFQVQVLSQARRIGELFNVDLKDGSIEEMAFTYEAFNLDWIVRTICSLQGSAILTKPTLIVNEIIMRAQKALNLYS